MQVCAESTEANLIPLFYNNICVHCNGNLKHSLPLKTVLPYCFYPKRECEYKEGMCACVRVRICVHVHANRHWLLTLLVKSNRRQDTGQAQYVLSNVWLFGEFYHDGHTISLCDDKKPLEKKASKTVGSKTTHILLTNRKENCPC